MNETNENIAYRWMVTIVLLVIGASVVLTVSHCSVKQILETTEIQRIKAETDKIKAEEGFKIKFGLTREKDK